MIETKLQLPNPLCVNSSVGLRKWFAAEKPKLVYDVGAHDGGMIGTWLELGAETVVAFEPVPFLHEKLVKRWEADARVVPLMLGVTDVSGRAMGLKVWNCWTLLMEGCGLEQSVGVPKDYTFDASFVTLGGYRLNGLFPDFIKIDVDGMETRVIEGAWSVLRSRRPGIMLELSYLPLLIGDSCDTLVRLLYEHDYRIVSMDGSFVADDVLAVMENFPWRTSFDVLAVPKEKVEVLK